MLLAQPPAFIALTLQEIDRDLGTDAKPQLILPIGTFHSSFYGQIDITQDFAEKMVLHWQNRVLGNRQPFVDTDHDRGAANGWITQLEVREDGLYATIEWTERGRQLVAGGDYRYFSADIAEVTDLHTGKKVYPVLVAVALTNTPVMNNMPAAVLHEQPGKGEEKIMDLNELLEAISEMDLSEITDEQRAIVVAKFGIETRTAEDTQLSERVAGLDAKVKTQADQIDLLLKETSQKTAELEELKSKTQRTESEAFIDTALSEGKILPKERETWLSLMEQKPDETRKLIEGRKPNTAVDLSERGVEDDAKGQQLSDEDRAVMKMFGIPEEDYRKYGLRAGTAD